jgi:hypothetical protein
MSPGETHLFFGCRRRDEDFVYEDEVLDFCASGDVTTFQPAFSCELLADAGSTLKLNGKGLMSTAGWTRRWTRSTSTTPPTIQITLFRWDVGAVKATGSDHVEFDCSNASSTFSLRFELWVGDNIDAEAAARPGLFVLACVFVF